MKHIYIAGPMTGRPQFNFPEFDRVANWLRDQGTFLFCEPLVVQSPAELDSPTQRSEAMESPDGETYPSRTSWDDYLLRDLDILRDINTMVLLPDWQLSAGARIEVLFALKMQDVEFYEVIEGPCGDLHLLEISRPALISKIGDGLGHKEDGSFTTHGPATVTMTWDTDDVSEILGEVRVTNEKTGGAKGVKRQRFELLPWDALERVAEVYGHGATKYEPRNWERGYDWSLSFGALQRHLSRFWQGFDTDPESDLPHLAHAAFHVLALLHYSENEYYEHLDDRPGELCPT